MRSLRGTNLDKDPRTGNYIWRKVDPKTGRRVKRSTRTPVLSIAIREAARFEAELETPTRSARDVALADLVPDFLASKECSPDHRDEVERYLRRALADLGLSTAADLVLRVVDDRLRKLEGKRSRKQMRRAYQDVLRSFSAWLAGNHRHLDRDPLAEWEPISLKREGKRPRRAFQPREVARALRAADELDAANGRAFPQRIVYLTLLVAGPRVGALAELDVAALDRDGARLALGADVGNKKRGAAALDPKTLAELEAYIDAREPPASGALLPSPSGARLDVYNVLPEWRQAFGLGLVHELWPASVKRDGAVARLVERYLATGKVRDAGGNPELVPAEVLETRAKQAERVRSVADRIRDEWASRMLGVDVHAFRTTHRTWAEAAGVHPVLIDKQLGHSTPGGSAAIEFARSVVTSSTGKKHYLDLSSSVLNAHASAEAVRRLLDEADAALDRGPPRGPPKKRKSRKS